MGGENFILGSHSRACFKNQLRWRFTSFSMFRSLPRLSAPLATTLAQRPVQYPYFVARNTRGNLPVYSDVRNAGLRYLIHIRHVDGNAKVRLGFFSSNHLRP